MTVPAIPPEIETTPIAGGTLIAGRYRILEPIGGGRAGRVYSAAHLTLRKKVAIKFLSPSLSQSPDAVARFQREALATSRIDHPNVAATSDYGRLDDGTMYMVLEYVEGHSLRQVIARGALPVARALHIAEQIVAALEAAHGLGIVHRDLKPEHVMLVDKGADHDWVKVLDFGVARVQLGDDETESGNALTKTGAVFGTPEYMAPEQAIGQKVDSRADQYSLGVILFEMIAGVRPYTAESPAALLAQQLTAAIPTFAERAAALQVPRSVERVVQRLLGKRPVERYRQTSEVVAAFAALKSGTLDEPEPAPLPSFDLGTRLSMQGVSPPVAAVPPGSALPRLPPTPPVPPAPKADPSLIPAHPPRQDPIASSGSRVATPWQRFRDVVETGRNRLPRDLQQRLAPISSPILLALLGFGLFAVITGLIVATRGGADRHESVIVASASTSILAASPAASGQASLVTTPASDEASALVEQAQIKLNADQPAEALALVTRVLTKHPELRSDPLVGTILFQTAASGNKAVTDASFSLLQGTMAGNGAEILYRLSLDRGVRATVRQRAERIVHSEQFERSAPGSVKLALGLRRADSCEKKHELVKLANQAGNELVLATLRELTQKTGCGLNGTEDCYPCLRNDSALADAIERVDQRGM